MRIIRANAMIAKSPQKIRSVSNETIVTTGNIVRIRKARKVGTIVADVAIVKTVKIEAVTIAIAATESVIVIGKNSKAERRSIRIADTVVTTAEDVSRICSRIWNRTTKAQVLYLCFPYASGEHGIRTHVASIRRKPHFECGTFDLSDNSPYISSVILAPEECKKNTQERYEIVKSEPAQSPVRWTFSADETAGASKNFESAPL